MGRRQYLIIRDPAAILVIPSIREVNVENRLFGICERKNESSSFLTLSRKDKAVGRNTKHVLVFDNAWQTPDDVTTSVKKVYH